MSSENEPRVRELWNDRVEDPHAWLEDPTSASVLGFLETENTRVDAFSERLTSLRESIFNEIKSRVKETDLSVPIKKDRWEYYGRTEEGSQYGVHCRRLAALDGADPGPEVIVIDENSLAEGHDYFEMGVFDISKDHSMCLYGIDTDGDETYKLHLLDISSSTSTPLLIDGVMSGSAWDNQGTSFLYVRPDETHRPFQVWRHVLGTAPSEDSLVYEEADPQFFVGLSKERDDSYVHIALGSAVTDEILLIPADDLSVAPVVVAPRSFGIEYHVGHRTSPAGDSRFYMHTNRDAQNFRLLSAPADVVSAGAPPASAWEEVVPHRSDVTLSGFDIFSHHMVLVERSNGLLQLRISELETGDDYVMDQPEEVSSVYPGANPESDVTNFRYVYASMVTPPMVCSYDFLTRERTVLKQTPVLGDFGSDNYATDRIWATADDGTEVPIVLVWRRDRGEGPHPAVLFGYGAYEATMDPSFSIARLSLLDRGFTFAIAQVRGGGELGRSWYEAGKYENKTRSFHDFEACARELIDRGLTTSAQLGIRGGSAGGLLVGAALNRDPSLYGAVVAEVPFVDVVNTMIDTSQQLTQIEWDEWGNPLESESVYRAMMSYSPYENVVEGDYPAMFVTAGLNDPRVRFWEPAKWVLRLREKNTGNRPILLKTEMGAGHFGSTGRYDAWRDEAEVLAFLIDALA
ncbi:MAG: S9 family peptidase [Acidimicrobiales bacterium]